MRSRRADRERFLGRQIGAIATTVVAFGLGSCSDDTPSGREDPRPSTGTDSASPLRTEHLDGDGPLSASSGQGGNSMYPPRNIPGGSDVWSGSWGALLLCSTQPDAEIVLEGVRTSASVEPLAISTSIREVTGEDIEHATGKARNAYAPYAGTWGSPPDFSEPYAFRPPAGSWTQDFRGIEITQTCDALADGEDGFTELFVTLEVDERGGQVSDVYIDYTADGAPQTLHTQWQMIACGTSIVEDTVCQS